MFCFVLFCLGHLGPPSGGRRYLSIIIDENWMLSFCQQQGRSISSAALPKTSFRCLNEFPICKDAIEGLILIGFVTEQVRGVDVGTSCGQGAFKFLASRLHLLCFMMPSQANYSSDWLWLFIARM